MKLVDLFETKVYKVFVDDEYGGHFTSYHKYTN